MPISDLGDSLRFGFKSEPPPTVQFSPDLIAGDFLQIEDPFQKNSQSQLDSSSLVLDRSEGVGGGSVFSTEQSVLRAVSVMLSTELAMEPSVRQAVRKILRSRCTVSTRPTEKGLATITPFHELFGLHFLDRKPVADLLNPPAPPPPAARFVPPDGSDDIEGGGAAGGGSGSGSGAGGAVAGGDHPHFSPGDPGAPQRFFAYLQRSPRTVFLRLVEAEADGLITISLSPPMHPPSENGGEVGPPFSFLLFFHVLINSNLFVSSWCHSVLIGK